MWAIQSPDGSLDFRQSQLRVKILGNALRELDVARTVRSQVDLFPRLWAVAFEGLFVLNFSIFIRCFSRMFLIYFQNFVFPLRTGRTSVSYTIPSVIFPKFRNISCFSRLFFLTNT